LERAMNLLRAESDVGETSGGCSTSTAGLAVGSAISGGRGETIAFAPFGEPSGLSTTDTSFDGDLGPTDGDLGPTGGGEMARASSASALVAPISSDVTVLEVAVYVLFREARFERMQQTPTSAIRMTTTTTTTTITTTLSAAGGGGLGGARDGGAGGRGVGAGGGERVVTTSLVVCTMTGTLSTVTLAAARNAEADVASDIVVASELCMLVAASVDAARISTVMMTEPARTVTSTSSVETPRGSAKAVAIWSFLSSS
jgi:hypothetical protein